MMLKVGLTGGIGSGKSTVARIFALFGIPVYFADLRAQELMVADGMIRNQVIALLGPGAYDDAGKVHRRYVAERVFQNNVLLTELNGIVHPAVRMDFQKWSTARKSKPYVIQEAAILFESGGADLMDHNIVVWAPEEIRLARVRARDGSTESEVRARMAHQSGEAGKVARADFIVINDGHHPLIRQVRDIHEALLWAATSASTEVSSF